MTFLDFLLAVTILSGLGAIVGFIVLLRHPEVEE